MMKKILWIFALIVLTGCGKSNTEVVVVEKTKSYHTENCDKVMMAKTETMTREEAQKMNCQPCKDCKPDSLRTGK
jgi:hypothetical protein